MVEYKLGYFATSLCGHDKDRLYMIVREEADMVGLCDGIHRFLADPKMKKKKHVQMMRSDITAETFRRHMEAPEPDRWIRERVLSMNKSSADDCRAGSHQPADT